MKNNTKRTTLAALFACAFAAASFGAVSLNVASATGTVETVPESFTMSESASLRLGTEENPDITFGLRFKTNVDQAWFNGLTNAQVYTLLVPTDMLTGELTASTENTVTVDVNEDKKQIVGDEAYVFGTVLTDIPDTAWGREISARSYITADEGTFYTPVVEGTFASASRSVVYVADAALVSNPTQWGAVDQYLITGVETAERHIEVGSSSAVKLTFREGTSAEAQAILNEKYPLTVTKTAGEECFTVENGVFTANSEGDATFTVANETLGISETVTVHAYKRAYGTLVDFNHLDATDYVDGYDFHNTSIATYDGQNAVKVSTTGVGNQLMVVNSNVKTPEWYDKFDTVAVKAAWVAEDSSAVTTQTVRFYDNATFVCAEGETIEKTILTTANVYKNSIVKSGVVRFVVRLSGNTDLVCPASMYFMGFTFGINDISNMGGTVNLYEKFHTEEGKATFKFGEEVIQNPGAYAGTVDGVITATISADGYADGTITANYDYTEVGNFSTPIVDFNNIDMTKIAAYGSATDVKAVTVDEATGKQAIEFTAVGNGTQKVQYGVSIACPAWVEDVLNAGYVNVTFDHVEAGGINWYLMSANHIKGKDVLCTNAVNTKTMPVNLSQIKEGKLNLFVASRTKGTTTSKFRITNIEFCFGKVVYSNGGENAGVNLLNYYGFAEGEMTNVKFTPDEGTAVDVTDLAAFKPEKSGKLTFTLNKAGYAPFETSAEVVVIEPITYTGTVLNLNNILNMKHTTYAVTYETDSGTSTELANANKTSFSVTESGTAIVTISNAFHGGYLTGTTFYIDVTVSAS